MLPFGLSVKVAYATGLDGTNNSGNAAGGVITDAAEGMGDSASEYQVKAAPIDGLTLGASYMEFSGSGTATKAQDQSQVHTMQHTQLVHSQLVIQKHTKRQSW